MISALYLTVTILLAGLCGYAAFLNFTGAESVKREALRNGVPDAWTRPLGGLLAAGALGLLAGFVFPPLGVAAAAGLVLYFLGAIVVHLRARYYNFRMLSVFLSLSVGGLALSLLILDGAP